MYVSARCIILSKVVFQENGEPSPIRQTLNDNDKPPGNVLRVHSSHHCEGQDAYICCMSCVSTHGGLPKWELTLARLAGAVPPVVDALHDRLYYYSMIVCVRGSRRTRWSLPYGIAIALVLFSCGVGLTPLSLLCRLESIFWINTRGRGCMFVGVPRVLTSLSRSRPQAGLLWRPS